MLSVGAAHRVRYDIVTSNKKAPVTLVAGTDRKSEMTLGFSFDAIKRALSIRNYRIYTGGNIVAHFGMWAFSKRYQLAEALETMPTGKGTG